MSKNLLQNEIEYFEKIRDELLGKAKNEYALIHGNDLISTFKSKEDAIKRGIELYGNTPFLVKLISEVEETYNFTSNLLSFA